MKMTPKVTPKCVECQKTETLLWRNVEDGQICQQCYEQKESQEKAQDSEAIKGTDDKSKDATNKEKDTKDTPESTTKSERLRKSTRATRFKARSSTATAAQVTTNGGSSTGNNSGGNKTQNKGRNRRSLFKKTPFKTPIAQATTHPVDSVFYKGSYLQVGDIVSLVDSVRDVYYAQIRGLLVDNYCEKSAFLTWLIPTQASPDPKDGFDPATYLIGPDEELSRRLSCLEFIMHAPSNYYFDRTTPYPLPDFMEYDTKPGGYIWTNLQEYKRNKSVQ